MAATSPTGLDGSRADLRRIQATDWGDDPENRWLKQGGDIAELCRQKLHAEWSQLRRTFDGEFVWDGLYRFALDTETVRWANVLAIIDRVEPGPHEDPNYFAMIAKEAAALEVALRGRELRLGKLPAEVSDTPIPWVPVLRGPESENTGSLFQRELRWWSFDIEDFQGILLGTSHSARLDAFSQVRNGAVLVPLAAGILDTQYWAAKAVATALATVESGGDSTFKTNWDEKDVVARLAADSAPADLLYDTLESWLYLGRPYPEESLPLLREQTLPLVLMIRYAKRFLLAHEYGHIFMDLIRPTDRSPSDWIVDSRTREYRADLFGFESVGLSADLLDHIPLTISLGGAAMALSLHEILDQASNIALTGKPEGQSPSPTHPSFQQRLAQLRSYYGRRCGAVLDQQTLELHYWQIGAAARVVELLWYQVKPRLQKAHKDGRAPHAMWLSQEP